MRKKRETIVKLVKSFSLLCVIIFGFITIIATGDSDNNIIPPSGPTVQTLTTDETGAVDNYQVLGEFEAGTPVELTVTQEEGKVTLEIISSEYTYNSTSGESGKGLFLYTQKVDPKKYDWSQDTLDEACVECNENIGELALAKSVLENMGLYKPSPKSLTSSDGTTSVNIANLSLKKDITVAVTPYKSYLYIPQYDRIAEDIGVQSVTVISGGDINIVNPEGKPTTAKDACFCGSVGFNSTKNLSGLTTSEIQSQLDNTLLLVFKDKKWQKVNAVCQLESNFKLSSANATVRLYPFVFSITSDVKPKIEQFTAIMKKITDLYATSEPTLDKLMEELRPLMSDGFLEGGLGPDATLSNWYYQGDEGPSVGVKADYVSLYRPMKNDLSIGPFGTWNELSGIYAGEWCVVHGFEQDGTPFSFLTSFVQETQGDIWKWYGNRIPFVNGGNVDAKGAMQINVGTSEIFKFTGLDFYTNDIGDVAKNTYSIDSLLVMNSALPEYISGVTETVNGLVLSREAQNSTRYKITSVVQPDIWDHIYSESYTDKNDNNVPGLNINNLTEMEFVFVGFDSGVNTEAKHVWIDLLQAKPFTLSKLEDKYFATLTAPLSMAAVNIPGAVTVSWVNPNVEGIFPDWVDINWSEDCTTWDSIDKDNPGYYDPNVKLSEWTSHTFDTTGSTVNPSCWFNINIGHDDIAGRSFEVNYYNLP